jgi:hypothetical protein
MDGKDARRANGKRARFRSMAAALAMAVAAIAATGCPRNITRPPGDPYGSIDAAPGGPDARFFFDRAPGGELASGDSLPTFTPVDGALPVGDATGDRGTPGDGVAPATDRPPADGAPPDAAPAAQCGNGRPDVGSINRAEALAIGPDGTIYYSQTDDADGFVGRLVPGAGRSPEPRWLRLPGASAIWGMAIDGGRRRLYVASRSNRAILAVDLTTSPPMVRTFLGGALEPNDLVVGPDGNVYFTEQDERHVYRISPAGMRARVTTSQLTDSSGRSFPAGLTFAANGDLLVGMSGQNRLQRLRLASGAEQSRAPFGDLVGWANGLAVDVRGRIHVVTYGADSQVVRLDADGGGMTTLFRAGWLSSIAFGRGALDCRDLYVSTGESSLRRVTTDAPGLPVP